MAKFRYCYEKALVDDGTLEGKLVMRFTISPSGRVTNAKVVSGMSGKVDACVTKVFLGLRFPKPHDGVSIGVSYPFVFAPK